MLGYLTRAVKRLKLKRDTLSLVFDRVIESDIRMMGSVEYEALSGFRVQLDQTMSIYGRMK